MPLQDFNTGSPIIGETMEKCLNRLTYSQQLLVHRRLCYSIYIDAMNSLEEQVIIMMEEENERQIKMLRDKMNNVNVVSNTHDY